ncbi:T9SS type A sorting domain-containing protein [bacterium]|nr:MAG: T9SS type A sorting domain-containing protein [bacterium]
MKKSLLVLGLLLTTTTGSFAQVVFKESFEASETQATNLDYAWGDGFTYNDGYGLSYEATDGSIVLNIGSSRFKRLVAFSEENTVTFVANAFTGTRYLSFLLDPKSGSLTEANVFVGLREGNGSNSYLDYVGGVQINRFSGTFTAQLRNGYDASNFNVDITSAIDESKINYFILRFDIVDGGTSRVTVAINPTSTVTIGSDGVVANAGGSATATFTLVNSGNDVRGLTLQGYNNNVGATVDEITLAESLSDVAPSLNQITGSEGWRLLSSPVSGATFADLLGDFWTQGIATGADVTNGTANVLTYNGSDFVDATDLTSTLSAGQGFAAYIFSDDDFDGNAEGFPKTISVTGTENAGTVSVTLHNDAQDTAWTLAGNPYASTVDWDDIALSSSGLTGVVYVYDHSIPGYISWNGSTGDLTDGLIAPFQGFFVQINSDTPSLDIPTSAKSTGATLYKSVVKPSIKLSAEMGALKNNTYFSFNENASEGLDNFDALKLNPLDFKNYLSLSTVSANQALSINNLPLELSQRLSVPVQVSAFEAGSSAWKSLGGEVMLSWSNMETLPAGWVVELVDELTGTRVDMKNQSSYTFMLEAVASKAIAYDRTLAPKSAAVESNSRFKIEFGPITTSVKELNSVPTEIKLLQNYPNPFNPTTQISFELPQAMNVKLSVYDMLGREVATLINGSAKAGLNTASWNALEVSSGLYIYRLQAGNMSFTKTMTLIK